MEELSKKKIAVLGYGIEGKDVVKYLSSFGISVTVLDQKPESELDKEGADLAFVSFRCGEKYLEDLDSFDTIFRSPGVYRYKSELVEAEKKGSVITSQIQLFFDLFKGKIIGVTGTKGKGTTSTLIYQTLKNADFDVYLAGNIGKPCLQLLSQTNEESWVVLELSSFQLIDIKKSPYVGVVLNITSDHMDWHANHEEYVNAKRNILKFQNENDFAVINSDYQIPKSFENSGNGQKFYFSRRKSVRGAYVLDHKIFANIAEKEEIGDTSNLILRGEHNWENISAAICATKLAGVKTEIIRKTAFEFKGLEHRLELVGECNGVRYYNDSFATGPQPTIAAVESFTEPETVIIGGYDKGLDYTEMVNILANRKNVNKIILIGHVGQMLLSDFNSLGLSEKTEYLENTTMDGIVKRASEITPPGGVVILSPAAASFDMFKDYKDRGNQFKSAVAGLKEKYGT